MKTKVLFTIIFGLMILPVSIGMSYASTTSVSDKNLTDITFSVYPNPFSKEINIEFNLTHECLVTIEIVNVLGETIETLVLSEKKNAGLNTIKYNSEKLLSGFYNCRIKADNNLLHKKIVKK